MSEGTEHLIVAFVDIMGVELTELGLVSGWMVELFEFVMRILTFLIITLGF